MLQVSERVRRSVVQVPERRKRMSLGAGNLGSTEVVESVVCQELWCHKDAIQDKGQKVGHAVQWAVGEARFFVEGVGGLQGEGGVWFSKRSSRDVDVVV